MAELPHLTVCTNIRSRRFKGEITNSIAPSRKLNVCTETLKSALEESELIGVKCEGKTLRFYFSDDELLWLHLMLRLSWSLLQVANPPGSRSWRFISSMESDLLSLICRKKLLLRSDKINRLPDSLNLDKALNKLLKSER